MWVENEESRIGNILPFNGSVIIGTQ
jgi:hypothetical protein